MTRLLYVYEERIPEALRKLVLSYLPAAEFSIDAMTYKTPPEEQKRKLSMCDVVLFAPGRYLSEEVLSAAKNVRLMQLWSSGYDKFNVAACDALGIPVANNGGANACSVAEHAVLLILAVYKWLPDSHRRVVEGKWSGNSHGLDMYLMHGKKLGIIGFGNIGKQVARKVAGFDMHVQYFDIVQAPLDIEAAHNVSFAPFETIIKESDIISLHLHANESTRNIIGRKEFSQMKKNAILINVSRAQLVDQEALREALEEKRIAGAGLDVYLEEPTKPNDPLLILPNVVATPHIAGSTYDTYAMVMERAVENFRRVMNGESPQWVVHAR